MLQLKKKKKKNRLMFVSVVTNYSVVFSRGNGGGGTPFSWLCREGPPERVAFHSRK